MLKRTPLYSTHAKLGGRLIEFGGWEMPVQYASIIEEHQAVRSKAGLFDISHMGQLQVSGPAAQEFLNHLLTNDVRKLHPGLGQYSLLCQDTGGVIDDLLVYQLEEHNFWLVINASRVDIDLAWFAWQHEQFPHAEGVRLENMSRNYGALAVQGPRVVEFINSCFSTSRGEDASALLPAALRRNQIGHYLCGGASVWVARTGYTGEDGFELLVPAANLDPVWEHLMTKGKSVGLLPAGLGARDTLRTEAGLSLYSHELTEKISPMEAGLERFVALHKPFFIGREALAKQQSQGVSKKCIAFKFTEKNAPPRPQYPIWSTGREEQPIGEVTSGTQSPSLGIGIGMGYVPPSYCQPETAIAIEIRGKKVPAVVVSRPIYKKAQDPKLSNNL